MHFQPLPGIRREDDGTTSHCVAEDAATAVISPPLSVGLSPSPFSSPAPYALSNGTEAAKANARGKKGKGEALCVFMR